MPVPFDQNGLHFYQTKAVNQLHVSKYKQLANMVIRDCET